jgi:methylated-DNA-[protein]-cysteine S-methyltransferase
VNYVFKTAASPVGLLKLVANDAGLAAVLWQNDDPHRVRLGPMVEATAHPILIETGHQLAAYFEGSLKAFDIPLDFKGTEFQKIVWAALLTIPFGETRSYGQIARQIGHPAAVRAVGCREWPQPYLDRRALPSGGGRFRRLDRVCRWSWRKALLAGLEASSPHNAHSPNAVSPSLSAELR